MHRNLSLDEVERRRTLLLVVFVSLVAGLGWMFMAQVPPGYIVRTAWAMFKTLAIAGVVCYVLERYLLPPIKDINPEQVQKN